MDFSTICFGVLEDPSSSKDKKADGFPSINNLPIEVLCRIFFLVPAVYRRGFRCVCKKWKDIMDTMVGTELRIGSFSEFDPDYNEANGLNLVYQPLSKISSVGIESCLVGNLLESEESIGGIWSMFHKFRNFLVSQEETPSTFKSPEILNSIQFFGRILPVHFQNLISELSCLRVLSIHLAALDSLDVSTLDKLDIPSLEKLIIRSGPRVHDILFRVYREWNMPKILKNSIALIQNYFPSLKAAGLEFVYDMGQKLNVTRTIFEFLHRHELTIKKFSLQFCLLVSESAFLRDTSESDNSDLSSVSNILRGTLKLDQLHLVPLCISTLPYDTPWTSIVKEQKTLHKFSIVGVQYKCDIIRAIVDFNFQTLTEICICRVVVYDSEGPLQFDCDILSRCQNLKVLVLRGWTITLITRNIINANLLPKSLVQIDIGDMAIGINDVRVIALEMPKLEDLELRFVGNKYQMGMDVDTLMEIICRRQLKICRLQRAINGTIPEGGIFNNDTADPDYISESIGGFIGFRLGKEGFYKRVLITDRHF